MLFMLELITFLWNNNKTSCFKRNFVGIITSFNSLIIQITEDFHQRCLSIEENNSLTEKLHKEVVVIYETYCVPNSKSYISFSPFVTDDLKKSQFYKSTH